MNLMGMKLAARVEFFVQQSMEKITLMLIPDRATDCEKRSCQRGIASLVTCSGVRHKGSGSSIVEEVVGHELTITVPMKCKNPRPSRHNENETALKESTWRVGKRECTTR